MSSMTAYARPPFSEFFAGLDLGKVSDPTAMAIAERRPGPKGNRYHVRALMRSPLGNSYPAIVEATGRLMAQPELRPRREYPADADGPARLEWAPLPTLVVDATGVGSAVVDLFMLAGLSANLVPLTITSGGTARSAPWPSTRHRAWWVPKIELVGVTQALLQTGRLIFAADHPLAEVIKRELLNFEVKVTQSAHETFGAWREGTHDDLVLAVALAVWMGERREVANVLRAGANPLGPFRGAWGTHRRISGRSAGWRGRH